MELRPQDWPRRRLRERGAPYLSAPELLAVVMTGLAAGDALELSYRLLARFGSLSQLTQAALAELCQVPGIGQARASQLLAALELGRRCQTDGQEPQPTLRGPADAAQFLQEPASQSRQEEIHALLLNTKNQVIGQEMVYRGTLNTTVVRPADVFREAVRRGAAAIVLAHTHPSGDVTPSPEDVRVTKELARAGQALEIELLDHLILNQQGHYYSLKEHGHLP